MTGQPAGHGAAAGGRALTEHDLAVPDSVEELLAVAVPYLREGLAAGDLTQVYVPASLAVDLRAAAPGIEVVSLDDFRAMRKPDAIIMRRRLLEEAGGLPSGRLRVLFTVCEPYPRAWQERERSEAVHNAVYADAPTSTLCVYERATTPPEALEAALHTHPHLRTAHGRVPNRHYREPRAHLASLPFPDEPLERTEPVLAFDDAPSLGQLRRALARALRGRGGTQDAEEDFHLACSEIAANAFRHGGRPVSARLWAGPDRLVCSITDGGRAQIDPLAGYEPAHGEDLSNGGMGLWLARKLCDHVDLDRAVTGLTVRLATAVRPAT
ncbi:anti-sigma factor RsbA family regulatory protein [Goekera deserti]|uniref:Sensor histidine kinase n=1 Tax=Goekera deserti TaxID=2497753 RepID=A0A7K3WJF2_9ACTN|nr:anti-sigma factor RsbA family regulatory protein [Goekera deserti]NDI49775.1 sensor histidine kinase [Goekera deserti]NEL56625.1 sensor histidine kinase [Goekera deserti]